MEHNSSENAGQKIRDPDIVSKIESGQVVTQAISRERLPFFLDAGLASGFKVEKIADEGQEYPHLSHGRSIFTRNNIIGGKVMYLSNTRVGIGDIAISVERPKGSKDHGSFWDNLRSLEKKKV